MIDLLFTTTDDVITFNLTNGTILYDNNKEYTPRSLRQGLKKLLSMLDSKAKYLGNNCRHAVTRFNIDDQFKSGTIEENIKKLMTL